MIPKIIKGGLAIDHWPEAYVLALLEGSCQWRICYTQKHRTQKQPKPKLGFPSLTMVDLHDSTSYYNKMKSCSSLLLGSQVGNNTN